MSTIAHLTLDTGHLRNSPSHEVGSEVIEALAPIVQRGNGTIEAWDIQMVKGPAVGSAAFTIHHDGLWIASGYMAWTSEGEGPMWNLVRELYEPMVMKPMCLPWLAVKLMPGCHLARAGVLMEAGDLERCLAWTVLDVFRMETCA